MPDLEILIKTLADTHGADAVRQALDKATQNAQGLGNAQNIAGQAAGKHAIAAEKLGRIFGALNQVVPGLGILMQAAFSPIGAAISVAVLVLQAFRAKIAEVNEDCRKMAEEAAKPLTTRLEAQRESVVKNAVAMEDLQARLKEAAKAEQSLKEQIDQAITRQKEQAGMKAAGLEPQMELELRILEKYHKRGLISEERYAELKLQIEEAYQKKKRDIELQSEAYEVMVKRRAVQQAQLSQPELTKAAEKAQGEANKSLEDLRTVQMDKPGVEKRKADAQKALAEWEAKWPEYADLFGQYGLKNLDKLPAIYREKPRFKEILDQWVGLKTTQERTESEWKAYPEKESKAEIAAKAADREAERTAKKAEENARFTTEGGRELEQKEAMLNERRKLNQQADAMGMTRTASGEQANYYLQGARNTAARVNQGLPTSAADQNNLMRVVDDHEQGSFRLRDAAAILARSTGNLQGVNHYLERMITVMNQFNAGLEEVRRRQANYDSRWQRRPGL